MVNSYPSINFVGILPRISYHTISTFGTLKFGVGTMCVNDTHHTITFSQSQQPCHLLKIANYSA